MATLREKFMEEIEALGWVGMKLDVATDLVEALLDTYALFLQRTEPYAKNTIAELESVSSLFCNIEEDFEKEFPEGKE